MWTKLNSKTPLLYLVPLLVASGLLTASLIDRSLMGPFFIRSALYADFAMVAFFIAFTLQANHNLTFESLRRAVKDNWIGLAIAGVVSTAVIASVEPSLRILADETNLLGVSKNLYYQRNASLTLSAKWYYDVLWPISNVIERRPTLYPFFVMLCHAFRGFRVDNAYLVNAIVIPLFIFQGYRFAKKLAGETFGIAAALLILAHPITLMSARSGGFDVIAAFFSLLVLSSFYDHCRKPSPDTLAFLWLYLCMTTHLRYEGMLTHALAFVTLIALRLVRWEDLQPRLLFYSVSPLLLLPRFWQAVVKANDQEQPLSSILFSFEYLKNNSFDYLRLVSTPFDFSHPHNPLLLLLGTIGLILALSSAVQLLTKRKEQLSLIQFSAFAVAWFAMVWVISFSYVWGKSLHPAAARLFVIVDAVFSLGAAWFVAVWLRNYPRWLTVLATSVFMILAIPVASEARLIQQLTLTRQTSRCFRFFKSLNENRILIITDRPAMYSVMNYGAIDFGAAKQNKSLLTELSRNLFQDIYVIQEIHYSTKKPSLETEIWPTVEKEKVLEFQNDANSMVRISKIKHKEKY